jgi:hypothetical protein
MRMPNKTILVKLRSGAIQLIRADRVEIHGDQLAFVTFRRKAVGSFLAEGRRRLE